MEIISELVNCLAKGSTPTDALCLAISRVLHCPLVVICLYPLSDGDTAPLKIRKYIRDVSVSGVIEAYTLLYRHVRGNKMVTFRPLFKPDRFDSLALGQTEWATQPTRSGNPNPRRASRENAGEGNVDSIVCPNEIPNIQFQPESDEEQLLFHWALRGFHRGHQGIDPDHFIHTSNTCKTSKTCNTCNTRNTSNTLVLCATPRIEHWSGVTLHGEI